MMKINRARIAQSAIILLFVFCIASLTQAQYKVVEVDVEGNRIASKSMIMSVAAIDLGSSLTPSHTTAIINRLYGLEMFEDIRLDAEEVTGGIKIIIVVKELPKLIGLEFDGNDKFDDRDIKEELQIGIGGYISKNLVSKIKLKLKEMYSEKGYFQAEIKPEINYSKDSTEVVLKVKIDEKSKVKVENVYLEGNSRVPDEDIIEKMRNRKRGFLKSSDFAQDKYDEDLEKIIDEFHKKGYLDAYLISDSISIDTTINKMSIYLNVYEGPQYYFGQVEFIGNEIIPEKALNKFLKFDENDIFESEKYDKSLEEIYSAYYDIGHLHIRILDEQKTVSDSIKNITYRIDEGLPSHINLVKIVGNRKTKDHVIRREISALPGQKFNRALLIRSVRDVMALNYFSNVNPVPINLPNGDVDIEFEIEEKQTGQVSAGAGYNSQDKVVGNIGLGIPNWRGMGQSISFNSDFGSRRNSLSLSFTEPWLFGNPTLLGTDLYSTNRIWFSDYTEARQGASIRIGKRLRWPDNFFRVFGSLRFERDKYHDFDDDFIASNSYKDTYVYHYINPKNTFEYHWEPAPTPIDSILVPTMTSRYDVKEPYPGSILTYDEKWHAASRFSINITRDSRNLPEFATSGSKISYTFEKTGGFMGGYWNYTKHSVTVAKFFPLFWKFALAAKVQFGAITTPSGTNDRLILLSDRFTPGGTAYDGIVRGYEDGSLTADTLIQLSDTTYIFEDTTYIRSVGPGGLDPAFADDTTITDTKFYTRVRGNYMLITNIELQLPIVEQSFYFLAFFDGGNSWHKWDDIKGSYFMYKSVGAGFRIVVPMVGTIGFDFGYALDDLRGRGQKWKTHFQLGTTFR